MNLKIVLQSCKIAHNFFHQTLFSSLLHSYIVHSAGLTKIEHGLTISEYAHTVIVCIIFQHIHEDFVKHTNQKTDAIGNGLPLEEPDM